MDTELEYGSYVPKPRRRHNGYYAGDFSESAPMPWEQLRRVMDLAPPSGGAPRGQFRCGHGAIAADPEAACPARRAAGRMVASASR